MFGRRHVKTRQELVRSEFGESLDHFRQAATHAAGGFGATVGPNYGMAKTKMSSARGWMSPASGKVTNAASTSWDATIAAFAPLMQAARDGAAMASKLETNGTKVDSTGMKRARKMTEETTPERHISGTVVALIATGAAVGAAGALAARRRNRVKWSEYEPSELHSDAQSLLDSSSTATTSMSESAREMGEAGRIKKATGWTKDHTKQAYDSVRHKIHETNADRGDVGEMMDSAKNKVSEVAEGARDRTKHANDRMNEGANHFAEKSKDKINETSSRASDSASRTADRVGDSVDDMLRSSKNGRM